MIEVMTKTFFLQKMNNTKNSGKNEFFFSNFCHNNFNCFQNKNIFFANNFLLNRLSITSFVSSKKLNFYP